MIFMGKSMVSGEDFPQKTNPSTNDELQRCWLQLLRCLIVRPKPGVEKLLRSEFGGDFINGLVFLGNFTGNHRLSHEDHGAFRLKFSLNPIH